MLNRNNHAVVVRNGVRIELCRSPESRVGAGQNRGAAAHPGWERTESKRIRIRILRQLMNAMLAKVSNAHGRAGAKGLLPFAAPSLKLRGVDYPRRGRNARRREPRWIETRYRCPDLRERFSRGEAVEKRCIRGGRILKEAGIFTGRKVVARDCVGIVKRGISKMERIDECARHRIIKETDTATQDGIV